MEHWILEMLQFMENPCLKSRVLDFLNDIRNLLVILLCGNKTQTINYWSSTPRCFIHDKTAWVQRAEITINSSVIGRHCMLNIGTIPHRPLLIFLGKSHRVFFRCFPLILAQRSMDLFATLVSFSLQQEAAVIKASHFPSHLSIAQNISCKTAS